MDRCYVLKVQVNIVNSEFQFGSFLSVRGSRMIFCYRNADVISNSERMMVKGCANARLYSFSQVENNIVFFHTVTYIVTLNVSLTVTPYIVLGASY